MAMAPHDEFVDFQWNHANFLSSQSPPPLPTKSKRAPRKGTPPGHIPRPPNAFILFRSENAHKIPKAVTKDQKRISRSIGELWRELSEPERAFWQQRAEEAKREHAARHPNYVFHPVKKTVVPRKRNVKGSAAADKQRDKDIAKLLRAGKDGEALARAVLARDEGRDPELPPAASVIPESRGWTPQEHLFEFTTGLDPIGSFSPFMCDSSELHFDYPREQYLPVPGPDLESPFNPYAHPSEIQFNYPHQFQ
ncbi:high mobility group box domain-containing protein [Mycena amicta]|nr:high mobility group box domain-containing protein [Mycena amicta]